MRPTTEVEPRDDPAFLVIVDRALRAIIRETRPADLFLIRVNNWFDHKWLRYSGRGRVPHHCRAEVALDHFWQDQLTFPPFTPKRIVSEHYFCLTTKDYYDEQAPAFRVHQRRLRHSAANLHRRIKTFSPSAAYVWFSSCSARNGRGSVMLYRLASEWPSAWYASLEHKGEWTLGGVKGADRDDVSAFLGMRRTAAAD